MSGIYFMVIEYFLEKKPFEDIYLDTPLGSTGKYLTAVRRITSSKDEPILAEWKSGHIILRFQFSKTARKLQSLLISLAREKGIKILDWYGVEQKKRPPKLTPKDKSVIQAFVDKKPMVSKKLVSNGEALECRVTNQVLFYWVAENKVKWDSWVFSPFGFSDLWLRHVSNYVCNRYGDIL